jgi:hypothetical protein
MQYKAKLALYCITAFESNNIKSEDIYHLSNMKFTAGNSLMVVFESSKKNNLEIDR